MFKCNFKDKTEFIGRKKETQNGKKSREIDKNIKNKGDWKENSKITVTYLHTDIITEWGK